MQIHFDKVNNLVGFAVENTEGGGTAKVLTRALLTSDDHEFYTYSEQISNIFLNQGQILTDAVHQFLVVIHSDLSADLYVNDFPISIEIRPKRDIEAGEIVTQNYIADIRKVRFDGIAITETDRVIYCFKVGWRFGLYFDLGARVQVPEALHPIPVDKLDVDKMQASIGDLRRYLSFYHVYEVLESKAQFGEMMKDGWFPFVEIISEEYKKLGEIYRNKFDFDNRVRAIVDGLGEERVRKITDKWWRNQIFAEKRTIIEAGVNAYLQNTQDGFVNCIKNLWTETEGILRKLYLLETGAR